MNAILPPKEDCRESFFEVILDRGLKQTWVSKKVGVSKYQLNHILHQRNPIPKHIRTKLNEVLGTNF
jgi:plasmid maintenance system antidote protein VapI